MTRSVESRGGDGENVNDLFFLFFIFLGEKKDHKLQCVSHSLLLAQEKIREKRDTPKGNMWIHSRNFGGFLVTTILLVGI